MALVCTSRKGVFLLTDIVSLVHDRQVEALLYSGEKRGDVGLPIDPPDVVFSQAGIQGHQMLKEPELQYLGV